ncbi:MULTISPECIES: transglutaminase family protein [unclassified Sphingomonas]|uniref:transglutaminase family protein n=1 Tax=unclassified Sphingomonas TaxID=196159 RepID=UPI0022B50485|nr:transglutaminase family protein [Sphingomonas sp. NIBR02145]WHU02764.1 transglutaminase family protein [Sphingomonas sp. NIBR02145]
MRIAIEHRTHYRFSEPQARVVQMLRLTPCDTQDQTVVSWLVGVDCDARLRDATDGFGNSVTMLYAEGPLEELDITVTGEVLTSESSGVIRGSMEPLPPLFYLRTTPRTKSSDALFAFASDSIGTGSDGLEQLHRLNAALRGRFPCVPDLPDAGCTAAKAFEGSRKVSSRDVAQMFIAAARGLSVPARYVSGYRAEEAARSAPHAWAEAYVEGLGWVGFDPSTGLSPDESYVRVAIGLDASSAAATGGMRIGHGQEQLDVDLHVDQLGVEE